VLVIQIDGRDLQAAQAGFAGFLHVLRAAVDGQENSARAAYVTEFRGDDHLMPPRGNGPADQFFIAAGAIHVRGIEKCHAAVERVMDGGN
jgi:hypothetical protein